MIVETREENGEKRRATRAIVVRYDTSCRKQYNNLEGTPDCCILYTLVCGVVLGGMEKEATLSAKAADVPKCEH